MKARFVLACAAASLGLMAYGAAAHADVEYGSLKISPDVVRPGETVTLSANCAHEGFTAPAPVESGALAPVDLTGEKDAAGVWRLTATTTVRPDVKRGEWSARFSCGPEGGVVVGSFTVLDGYAAIGVTDKVITPGKDVQVTAGCHDPRFVSSKVVSPVLTAPDLVREKGASIDAVLFSAGKIAADAKPGTYPISFTCVDREITNEFTVVAAGAKPGPQVSVKPAGAPETGSLDPAPADDSDRALAPALTLVAAGAAGVLALRRHRRV